MFMKNTCLYPFYAYIFEQLKHGKTLLDYENIFAFSRNHVSCLDNRKKEIWCNTRNILNLENELEKVPGTGGIAIVWPPTAKCCTVI